MLGALFGDIAGGAYEWNNVKTKDFPSESKTLEMKQEILANKAELLPGSPF